MPSQKNALVLEDNQMCFACGSRNPMGLKLQFEMTSSKEMVTEFIAQPEHQGYKGILHGGILSLVLDEAMVNITWKQGLRAVSAELKVRLKKVVRTGERVGVTSRIAEAGRRLIRTTAQARVNGVLVAEADAVCMRIRS